jgi:GT2 family glycosyltransferase
MPRDWPHTFIVVLNWNRADETIACLRSLETLTYPNLSMYVVDNGSTDQSPGRIQSAFPSVEIARNEVNLGYAGGNNVGIREGLRRGADFVWILNNDTIVRPQTLDALVATAEADASVGAVGSVLYTQTVPTKVQSWGGGWLSLWLGLHGPHRRPVRESKLSYLHGASILVRAKAIEDVGMLDEGFFMYWEDADYSWRLRRKGSRLAVAPSAVVLHRESGSLNPRDPRLDSYRAASTVRFLKRYAPIPAIPIGVSLGLRLAKRVLTGEWHRARVLSREALRAWRSKSEA